LTLAVSRIHYLAAGAAIVLAAPGYAATYHTVESAQKACFPEGADFTSSDAKLTREQMKAIEKDSGVRVRLNTQRVWKATRDGRFIGWFIVDEVLGKHEFINWALALNADGSVRSIEVMDYRETYGYEIRNADWRAQFLGKKHGAKFKLDDDIKNISGATLSCRHITDGVKRLLSLYELVLKGN
jgi:Na+-translocating ferredoxin:NAD+ oxidoreductase RnfG subunit